MKNTVKLVKGNLIELLKEGEFDVGVHGCNCFNTQGGGIAKQMAQHFLTNDPKFFVYESGKYKGNINKLGTIDFNENYVAKNNRNFTIVNAYTQYGFGDYFDSKPPVDYEAIALCFKKINHIFKGKDVGIPKIGCGLAGGNWEVVSMLVVAYLNEVNVTVVEL